MLQAPEPQAPGKLAFTRYVGCSGWFYWNWRKGFYPPASQPDEWFDHYARAFNTVELNAPYYSWPTTAAVKAWRSQARKRGFAYTVKVNELITHTRRFSRTAELVKDFGLIADLLGPVMGCFLFQFPASFKYSRARLDRIVTQLDPAQRNVVEFRHKSWWNKRVYETFRGAGIVFCSCSGPRLPDELIVTAPDIYIRFHGTKRWYRHDYTRDELKVWADRVKSIKCERVWAYFNNTNDGHAVTNARTFKRLLSKVGAKRAPTPANFDEPGYAWKPDVDYRSHPELYRVGRANKACSSANPTRPSCCRSGVSAHRMLRVKAARPSSRGSKPTSARMTSSEPTWRVNICKWAIPGRGATPTTEAAGSTARAVRRFHMAQAIRSNLDLLRFFIRRGRGQKQIKPTARGRRPGSGSWVSSRLRSRTK